MLTGQISSHALQDVQAQTSSGLIRSNSESDEMVISPSKLSGGETCGLPVAAYPVTGPLDVIGHSKAGALHEDLRTACLRALEISREDALTHAKRFSWRAASEQFLSYLHPRGVREVQQLEVPV